MNKAAAPIDWVCTFRGGYLDLVIDQDSIPFIHDPDLLIGFLHFQGGTFLKE
jgi:hypothetical protein